MRRPAYVALAVIVAMLAVAGCGKSATPAKPEASPATPAAPAQPAQKVVLKAAHVLANTSHYQIGMEKFASLVSAKTNGAVEIQISANGILGSERDMVEGMQMGTLDIGLASTAPIGQFSPSMMLFDLPFLFRDGNHAWKVADGPIGDKMFADLEKKGIVGLAYWENGFRHVFTRNKEIKSPDDIKGLKIRTMENPVHVASFKAMGAVPTPMAWGEVFTGLQQGTVDGAENSLSVIYTSRFQEVSKYTALTGHFYGIAPLLMSKKSYDKLPDSFKKAIREAAIEARDFQRKATVDLERDLVNKLQQAGMKVVEVDRDAFREKCKAVYDQFKDQVSPELVKEVLETK